MNDLNTTSQKKQITNYTSITKMSTVEISQLTGKRHDNVMRKTNELAQKGIISSPQSEERDSRGKLRKIYTLNKIESLNLVANLSPEFTAKIIDRWQHLESLVSHKQSKEWIESRESGKIERRSQTDAIKEFVEYAEKNGSGSPKRYYTALTRMQNAQLFIVKGKHKNLRNVMSSRQLNTTSVADGIIERAIHEGLSQKLFYKDIFKLAKKRIINFAKLYGKSEIIDLALQHDSMKALPEMEAA